MSKKLSLFAVCAALYFGYAQDTEPNKPIDSSVENENLEGKKRKKFFSFLNKKKSDDSITKEDEEKTVETEQKVEQVNAKLLRVDVLSLGVPRMVGIGAEGMVSRYIPFEPIKNKFSVFANISPTSFLGDIDATSLGDNAKVSLNTYEIGVNWYLLNRKGTGPYVSLSFNKFDADLKTFDISELTKGFKGTLDGEISQYGINAKLGYKAGNKFYFRIEVGYSEFLDNVTGKFNGTVQDSNGNFNIDFNDAKFTVKDVLNNIAGSDIPPVTFNIGFGISFL